MFAINKNGTKHKIGIIMPAFFPASRVTYDNSQSGLSATKAQEAIDEVTKRGRSSSSDFGTAKNGAVVSTSMAYSNAFVYGKLVMLKLRITVPTISTDTVIFSLSNGYIPVATIGYVAVENIWDSTITGRFIIDGDGNITALASYCSGKDLTLNIVYPAR